MRRLALPVPAVLAVLVGTLAAAAAELPQLAPVPPPALERMEKAVQDQFREAGAMIEAASARAGGADPALLAEAYGRLGQLSMSYHVSDTADASLRNARTLAPEDMRWSYLLGALYQNDRRLDEAVAALERTLVLSPGYLPALIRLAQVRLLLDQPDRAKPLFEQVLAAQPQSAAARHGLGRIAYGAGDFKGAIAHFEAALALQPDANAIRQPLGIAYRDAGDLDKAREHLQQAGQVNVRFEDPLIQSLQATGARAHLLRGGLAFRRGDYDLAIAEFRKALEVEPEDLTARKELAVALERKGETAAALAEYRRVLAGQPDNPVSHYDLGSALLRNGGPAEEGIAHLRTAVERAPDFEEAWVELGRASAAAGDHQAALGQLGKALELDPQNVRARLARARALARLGRDAEAIEDLERLLVVEPANVEGTLDLATLFAKRGDRDRALARLDAALALALDPAAKALVQFNAANLLLERGDDAGALERYRAAVELGPDFKDAHFNYAAALGKAGRFADAAVHFGRAAELDRTDRQAFLGQGLMLVRAGRPAEAKAAFERGLAAHPDNPEISHALARLLAGSVDAQVRDGARALELAQKVFTARQSPETAETLALALAAAGRFDEAAQLQGQIVQAAERANQPAPYIARLEQNLERYRSRRPGEAGW